ncbi:hypothetical protein [Chryseobacterium binzhouense]|uniref:hypothetical protein n=1 Tax=Chryseobacterium binzhouense TaxID=2593646 RepID=UPI00117E9F28|nr:hypothetical protein [Chryseobacterium binzhouense]
MTEVNFKTVNIGNVTNVQQNNSNMSKFETADDLLWISNIQLIVKNVNLKNIYWRNLIKKKSKEEAFKLDPNVYSSYEYDLLVKFSNEKIVLDLEMPAYFIDLIENKTDRNLWDNLRHVIIKLLNIDISSAKVKGLRFILSKSIEDEAHFNNKIELEGYTQDYETASSRKFISVDRKIEYNIYKYSVSNEIVINEAVTIKKRHEFLKLRNYSDFMNSYLETEMREIIFEHRKMLKIHN